MVGMCGGLEGGEVRWTVGWGCGGLDGGEGWWTEGWGGVVGWRVERCGGLEGGQVETYLWPSFPP